jgi:hypothetical protein
MVQQHSQQQQGQRRQQHYPIMTRMYGYRMDTHRRLQQLPALAAALQVAMTPSAPSF